MLKIVNNHIESKLNPEDYVFMHKAELKSILVNSRSYGIGVEIFDRLGSILIGVSGTLFSSVPDASLRDVITYALFGFIATGYGYFFRKQRNNIIEDAIKNKLD